METKETAAMYNVEDGESPYIMTRTSNVATNLIEITEDKLKYILLEYIKGMGTKTAWLSPLGLFITISATIYEVPFESGLWEKTFTACAGATLLWTGYSLWRLASSWGKSSPAFLIGKIKGSGETRKPPSP